jgi:hypothetical protein
VSSTTIQVVRGRLDPASAEQLIEFWAGEGALFGDDARRRLPEVVCVLRADGRIAGACSVREAEVPLIGGRRFWVYRSLLAPEAADQGPEMISATFATLEREFDLQDGSPIGLCLLLSDAERPRRPEADWYCPPMVYAGYLEDGRQVRVGYFDLASAGPQAADA